MQATTHLSRLNLLVFGVLIGYSSTVIGDNLHLNSGEVSFITGGIK